MLDRIKQDIAFRNKVILGALLFIIIVAFTALFFTEAETSKNHQVEDKTNQINLIPADTSELPKDKTIIYSEDKMWKSKENRTLDLVNNEADFGLTREEVKQKEQEENKVIDEYMMQRREQTRQIVMQSEQNKEREREYYNSYNNDYATAREVPNDRVGGAAPKKKTPEELEREYIESLRKAKEERTVIKKEKKKLYEFRAVFYLDQWVVPGDRARLILPKDVIIDGKVFEKGTDVYATVSINQSRVILRINSINHYPVDLMVKDLQDGEIGVYNTQAGKLWREYQQDLQEQTINQLGKDLQADVNVTLVNTGINTLRAFFSKKKYADRERILLLNDHEVILTNNFKKEDFKDEINK